MMFGWMDGPIGGGWNQGGKLTLDWFPPLRSPGVGRVWVGQLVGAGGWNVG